MESPQVWLDVLPLEVGQRIIQYTTAPVTLAPNDTPTRNTPAALALAKACPHLRAAVIEELSYQVVTSHTRSLLRWVAFFKNDIRSLDIRGVATGITPYSPIYQLLSADTLRRAVIPDQPVLLDAVSASNINDLHVSFRGHATHVDVKPVLWEALKNLPTLEKLTLTCSEVEIMSYCAFCDLFREPADDWKVLANACPLLASLHLFCFCFQHPINQFTEAFKTRFPELKTFEVNRAVEEAEVSKLRQIPDVRVSQSPDGSNEFIDFIGGLPLATQVGNAVTELKLVLERFPVANVYLVDGEALASLAAFPRLQVLTACLEGSHPEDSLPTCIKSLRILHFVWRDSEEFPLTLSIYSYPAPSPGVLPSFVARNENLKELSLFLIRLPLSEIHTMLSQLGNGLQLFGTSVAGQDEGLYHRVVGVLDGLRRWNPNLRVVRMVDLPRVEESVSEVPWERFRKFLPSVHLLQARLCHLDVQQLLKDLKTVFKQHAPYERRW